MPELFDLDKVRERLPMLRVCEGDGMDFRREGGNWVARCPFHVQKSRSFTIHSGHPNHGHCYGAGCGWHGDIFKFWQDRRGCDFPTAAAALAGLAGLAPLPGGVKWEATPKRHRPETMAERVKPALPELRKLRPEEIEQIAALRKLPVAGVQRAAAERMLGFGRWPLDRDGREWSGSRACWVVTDDSRWCAQFRLMSGKEWDCGAKSLSTKNVCWPVGAANLRGRRKILLTEGSPDCLAGWSMIEAAGAADEIAVVCIFGSAVNLAPEGIAAMRGCRVLIAADADEPKARIVKGEAVGTYVPGMELAAAWQYQLEAAGIPVAVADLSPLKDLDPEAKDLNDLVTLALGDIDPAEFLDF